MRHYATSRKVAGSSPDEVVGFFSWRRSCSRTMVLGSTPPLTEVSTRNLPGDKWRPARKADKLTAICVPIVWKMWEPRPLTTLRAFTACCRDGFALTLLSINTKKRRTHLSYTFPWNLLIPGDSLAWFTISVCFQKRCQTSHWTVLFCNVTLVV
jgi:hypothetical protein